MPESAVRKLHPEPTEKVVATAVSLVVGVADDRQITFQSGYEGDEPDEVVFERIQRNLRFADRLKAIYETPKLEDDIAEHDKNYAQLLEDWADADERFARDQAERQVQIDTITRDSVAAWNRSQKRGEWRATGAHASSLENIHRSIHKAEEERKQQLDLNMKTRERWTDKRAELQRKLDRAKALAEG